ncbi:Longin-like domain-containing protein [Aspergillus californicus]
MTVYSLIIINKAGGLVYQREFQPGLRKLSTNDYLVLAGTFHGVHAITRTITPRIPNPNAVAATSTSTSTTPIPTTSSSAILSPTASAPTPTSAGTGTGTPTTALPFHPTPAPSATPSNAQTTNATSTSTAAAYTYPNPGVPRSGLETLESDKFTLTCFQTLTGTKFLLFTDPEMGNIEGVMKTVYELYADYVMKNPFYQLEMPVRCEGFERGLGGFLRGRA